MPSINRDRTTRGNLNNPNANSGDVLELLRDSIIDNTRAMRDNRMERSRPSQTRRQGNIHDAYAPSTVIELGPRSVNSLAQVVRDANAGRTVSSAVPGTQPLSRFERKMIGAIDRARNVPQPMANGQARTRDARGRFMSGPAPASSREDWIAHKRKLKETAADTKASVVAAYDQTKDMLAFISARVWKVVQKVTRMRGGRDKRTLELELTREMEVTNKGILKYFRRILPGEQSAIFAKSFMGSIAEMIPTLFRGLGKGVMSLLAGGGRFLFGTVLRGLAVALGEGLLAIGAAILSPAGLVIVGILAALWAVWEFVLPASTKNAIVDKITPIWTGIVDTVSGMFSATLDWIKAHIPAPLRHAMGLDDKPTSPNTVNNPNTPPVGADVKNGASTASSGSSAAKGMYNNLVGGIVGQAESKDAGYDALNGQTNSGKMASTTGTRAEGKNLTTMTVAEVMAHQQRYSKAGGGTGAAGKYQIMPGTLKGLVDSGTIKSTDMFDAGTQDRGANALLTRQLQALAKSGKVRDAKNPTQDEVTYAASQIWAGLPQGPLGAKYPNPKTGNRDPNASYYGGQQGNKANVKLSDVQNAISMDQGGQSFRQFGSSLVNNPLGALGGIISNGARDASTAFVNAKQAIFGAGKEAQSSGLKVSENANFGGVTRGVHSGHGHDDGRAIDINAPGGVNESKDPKWKAIFDKKAQDYQSKGFIVLWNGQRYDPSGKVTPITGKDKHYNHMHLEAPKSGIRTAIAVPMNNAAADSTTSPAETTKSSSSKLYPTSWTEAGNNAKETGGWIGDAASSVAKFAGSAFMDGYDPGSSGGESSEHTAKAKRVHEAWRAGNLVFWNGKRYDADGVRPDKAAPMNDVVYIRRPRNGARPLDLTTKQLKVLPNGNAIFVPRVKAGVSKTSQYLADGTSTAAMGTGTASSTRDRSGVVEQKLNTETPTAAPTVAEESKSATGAVAANGYSGYAPSLDSIYPALEDELLIEALMAGLNAD